jgi:hypothetical protein
MIVIMPSPKEYLQAILFLSFSFNLTRSPKHSSKTSSDKGS